MAKFNFNDLLVDALANKAYGGIYVEDGSTAEASTDATPRRLVKFVSDMPANNTTLAATSGTITCPYAGTYLVSATLSYNGTANKTFVIEVYKDTTATNIKVTSDSHASGEGESTAVSGLVTLTAGQALSLYHSSTDGGIAFTLTNAQFTAVRLL